MGTINQFINAGCMMCILVACSSTSKSYVSYSDWDRDNDQQINRSEFVDAYLAQDFFERWSGGGGAISYNELFNEAFLSIDSDKDGKLSLVEFNSQIKRFYFGMFSESFERWDGDSNAGISKAEFTQHATSSNLGSLWDTDRDKRISEREMAGGMFYICDSDSNGTVSNTELDTWRRNR